MQGDLDDRGIDDSEHQAVRLTVGDQDALAYLGGRGLGELFRAERDGTRVALTEAGRPNATITFPHVTPHTLGQYLYKSGADIADGTIAGYLLNWRLLSGVVCYIAVMVLFVAAFRKGGALTVLYPVYASTFIWAAIIALLVYGTPIKAVNVAGMAFLVLGMFMMGK